MKATIDQSNAASQSLPMIGGAFAVVWFGFTNPVREPMAPWTAASMPNDWSQRRSQWQYSHLARLALHLTAFISLVAADADEPR